LRGRLNYKYFNDTKRRFFVDNSFNYNLCPKDVRSNSILEKYNQTIKAYLSNKRECNWVLFMHFIQTEIKNIITKLGKNENKNILYEAKFSKFNKEKFINNENKINISNMNKSSLQNKFKVKIGINWLRNKAENCRYISFVTLYYFTFLSFVNNENDKDLDLLKQLNKLIINLSQDVNDNNLNLIIEFFQSNKFDIDNQLLDVIKKTKDTQKKFFNKSF